MRKQRLCVLGLILLFLSASPLLAVDPNRHISQYAHTVWRVQDGVFKGSVNALAQTPDGYVWIGTMAGLLRFDGVRFVPWNSADGAQLPSPEIYSLLVARDGSMWIATRSGLSHYVNQHLVNYLSGPTLVTRILEDHQGTIWFTTSGSTKGSGPLCRVSGVRFQCYGSGDGMPNFTYALLQYEDSEGFFWIGGDTGLVRWKPGSATVIRPNGLRGNDAMGGVEGIVPEGDGSMWVGMFPDGPELGLQRLVNDVLHPFVTAELDGRNLRVMTLFMDSHHALWIGTENAGVYRVFANRVDHFQSADGLSSDTAIRFMEDREGNIWVATSEGLDKFSDRQVATYSTREGIVTDWVTAVLAAHDGTVWVGGNLFLTALRDGKATSIEYGKGLPGDQVTSLFEDRKSRLWVGINAGLAIYEKGKFRLIEKPDRTPFGVVTDITEDTDQNIWLETIGPPRTLYRIHDDRVQEQFPAPAMPAARQVAADPAGGIWIGTRSGDLVHYRNGRTEFIRFPHDVDAQVEDLLVEPDGRVLGATAFGLIAWNKGKKQILTVKNGLPCNTILAMIHDNAGALWLSTQCGLVEIAGSELEAWWRQPDRLLKVRVFDQFDGVQSGWAPFQKIAKTPDGRVWFIGSHVLQMINPGHLYENLLPPPVQVEGVMADGKSYLPAPDLRLPALTRDLEIDYTALSFVIPQKVRFRYRLEGHDTEWRDPGTRREAFYNDLGPGTFTFHVIACNDDGVWNNTRASLKFTIAPAWYQTGWFRLLWIASACFLLIFLFRVRVRSISKAMSVRFDERLDERTRMARELHDTFLQTVQGSKIVADDALASGTDEDRMRRALEKLSCWLGQAVSEGRTALHALRVSATERNELAEFLERTLKEQCHDPALSVAVTVVGDARKLHPIVRDEVSLIAREAIHNACLHSRASQVRVELRYADDLRLCFKDNGIGIDPVVLDAGKSGHFGLQGMKERSARIRARISIASYRNHGTEVMLRVPGDAAYLHERRTLADRLFGFFRARLGKKRPSNSRD